LALATIMVELDGSGLAARGRSAMAPPQAFDFFPLALPAIKPEGN